MKLSIIIVNYNTRGLLRQCLKGIYLFPPTCDFEIIVVDNGSRDKSHEMVSSLFPRVQLIISHKNEGYAAGSNFGLLAATGEYVLFLNSDAVVLENSLHDLLGEIELRPRAAMVGPQLLNPDRSRQDSAFAFHQWMTPWYQRTRLGATRKGKQELDRFLLRQLDLTQPQKVPWLMSSCVIVRRQIVLKLGGFDERFFVYLADTDLCRRIWKARYEIWYVPTVSFIHYHRRQSAEDLRVALIHARDFFRYQMKWRKMPGA